MFHFLLFDVFCEHFLTLRKIKKAEICLIIAVWFGLCQHKTPFSKLVIDFISLKSHMQLQQFCYPNQGFNLFLFSWSNFFRIPASTNTANQPASKATFEFFINKILPIALNNILSILVKIFVEHWILNSKHIGIKKKTTGKRSDTCLTTWLILMLSCPVKKSLRRIFWAQKKIEFAKCHFEVLI